MPKITRVEDLEEAEDDLEEEEIDELEEDEDVPHRKNQTIMTRLKKEQEEDAAEAEEERLEELRKQQAKSKPKPIIRQLAKPTTREEPKEELKEVKRRFGIIAPQPIRIVDEESREVVGEGEYAILQALTDILERLERIEYKIGGLVD